MYNIDFLRQTEKSRIYLFRAGCFDREIEEAFRRYFPPAGVEILECHEDINGEWVPNPAKPRPVQPEPSKTDSSKLEKKIS